MPDTAIPSGLPALPPNPRPGKDPAKARDAAQQFEALLLGQILRSVREASGAEQSDQAGSCASEFAEQQFALVLARQGGLGLAALIARGLEPKPAASEPPTGGAGL
jgi:Rod binding domain-containing protein